MIKFIIRRSEIPALLGFTFESWVRNALGVLPSSFPTLTSGFQKVESSSFQTPSSWILATSGAGWPKLADIEFAFGRDRFV